MLDAVKAAGGIAVGEVLEPDRRFPLVVRLPMSYRDDPHALERILIPTATGQRLPLTQLATLEETHGPSTIQREWGQRRIVVQANVRGRDLGSFVEEAQARIEREVKLPPGYTIDWGGQFENMLRAERRLFLVVPLALALILSLLYLTFHSLRDALMIFSGVLFARVGGVLGLYVMGLPFTISAGVGLRRAGRGVDAGGPGARQRDPRPDGPRHAEARGHRAGPAGPAPAGADDRHGRRAGFVPMMLSTGIGAEVQRPLATVVVFGMACDTFLTMLALPVLYLLFGKGPRKEPPKPTVSPDVGQDQSAARPREVMARA